MPFGDASKDWREQLKTEVGVFEVMHSLAITKYYDLAEKTLDQADLADKNNELAHAYVFYKRWVHIACDVIPKHNYYRDPRYQVHARSLVLQSREVEKALRQLVERMDVVAEEHAERSREKRAAHEARLREQRDE
eukprot:CAMPEP_0205909082 /NCGR_PEP_ID=MMETSP1325-20131115/3635_1 /ASSEMBLY_ACC=CAM_ASM_000708 /TAXON_ID=236786 /ORGANISM="Florenciella sp., Strain RCC1007" /LENGTH=134 /DNA_ID=CAMNT_0053275347 /DNA_START=23 /DNA_END=424 /DNA_ORIENTATION=+